MTKEEEKKKKKLAVSSHSLIHWLLKSSQAELERDQGVIHNWEARNLGGGGVTGGLTAALDASTLLMAVIQALAEHYSPFSMITATTQRKGRTWGVG